MSKTLTGIRDVDMKIVNMLNDFELGKVCQANKYINEEICKNQNFWRNRVLDRFGKYLGDGPTIKEKYLERNIKIPYGNWESYYKYLLTVFKYRVYDIIVSTLGHPLYQDLQLLARVMYDNTQKLIKMQEDGASVKEIDEFLNNNFLIDYTVAILINYRPDLLKYYLERSKTDIRFFPLFRETGKEWLREYESEDPIELLKIIIKDKRIDPTHGIVGLVERLPDQVEKLILENRIRPQGVLDIILDIARSEEEEIIKDLLPKLLDVYMKIHGPDLGDQYAAIVRNLTENGTLGDGFFINMLNAI